MDIINARKRFIALANNLGTPPHVAAAIEAIIAEDMSVCGFNAGDLTCTKCATLWNEGDPRPARCQWRIAA